MYTVSYLGSDGKYHVVETDVSRNDAIVLVAEGRDHGVTMRVDRVCDGHPADEFSPMGETQYCDGSCLAAVQL